MATIRCPGAQFHNIEAIIFDKDGTLADSHEFLRTLAQVRSRLIDARMPGVQEPLLMAFGVEGNTLNPQGLMAVGTRYENEIAAAAYVAETGRNWAEALDVVRQSFQEADRSAHRKAKFTPPYPGTEALLAHLSAHNLKVGIFSSDTTENVNDFVQFHQLTAYVNHAQGTDQASLAKPNPELVLLTCEALGVSPQVTLFLGDSILDSQAAHNAQLAGFVYVNWLKSKVLLEADAVINSWLDLELSPDSVTQGII
ncbi:MAG TPA: HAD family hydrolase [Leptolyngbyaceae cyanobacterium]